MGTSWAEIITNSAMVFIDDVRMTQQLSTNPARFLHRLSAYVTNAMPLLATPPELFSFLVGGMSLPAYADFEWESTQTSMTQQTVVETGNDGFSLMCCMIREVDAYGNVTETAYKDAVYDAQTGNVTFPIQTAEGLDYVMDFYTDGSFSDLTVRQKRLFGLAIASVWDERFERNWLNITQKVHDDTFNVVNESNYMAQASARKQVNNRELAGELRKYEQDCTYAKLVAQGQTVTLL